MKVSKENRGFSLIELIIVTAVIAVLIGVLAPQFLRYVEKSKRTVDLQHAQTMVEVFEEIRAAEDVPLRNYNYTMFWNADQAELYDYDAYISSDNMMERVFAWMGGVPVSKVNAYYFFTVVYNVNGIQEVYLDELPFDMKTKLYPDDGSFYKNGFK